MEINPSTENASLSKSDVFLRKVRFFLTLLYPQIFRAVIGPHEKSRDFSLLFSYFMKSLQHISKFGNIFGICIFIKSQIFFCQYFSNLKQCRLFQICLFQNLFLTENLFGNSVSNNLSVAKNDDIHGIKSGQCSCSRRSSSLYSS